MNVIIKCDCGNFLEDYEFRDEVGTPNGVRENLHCKKCGRQFEFNCDQMKITEWNNKEYIFKF